MKRRGGRSGRRTGTGSGTLARLREEGLSPRKSLGQHFLHDRSILEEIVAAADVGPEDRVLEVGTGPGLLTRQLAVRAQRVLTVEVDRRMMEFAGRELRDLPNIDFLEGDVLEGRTRLRGEVVAALRGLEPFLWVSNLPYGLATTLIVLLCESGLRWTRAALTVQEEVAERILAGAGDAAYGPVSALVAYWADARRGRRIVPGSFWPPPRVHSRVLVLERRGPLGKVNEYPGFRHWVKALFPRRRKQIRRILRDILGREQATEVLAQTGWRPEARPEDLEPGDFLLLARSLPPAGDASAEGPAAGP